MNIGLVLFSLFLTTSMTARAKMSNNLYKIGAIVCPKKVELIDYFEGRRIKDIIYPQKLTPNQIVRTFRDVMPDRADQYLSELELFDQLKKETSSHPPETFDPSDLVIRPPEGCHAVILIKTDFVKILDIESDIWNQMKITDKSGAILHWLIAKEVYESIGQLPQGTVYVRNVNSLLPTQQLKDLPLDLLTGILKSAQLPSLRRQGVLIDLRKNFNLGKNQFLVATPLDRSTWTPSLSDHLNPSKKLPLLKSDPVDFYPTGSIHSLRLYETLSLSTSGGTIPFSTPDHVVESPFPNEENPRIYFDTNGSVLRGSVFTPAKFQSQNLKLILAQYRGRFDRLTYSLLVFWPNGQVRTVTNSTGSLFAFGKWLRIQNGGSISLQENGIFQEFISLDTFEYIVQGLAIQWTGHVLLYPDGALKCAYLVHKQVLKTTSNIVKAYDQDQQVCFDFTGLAIP